MVFGAVFSPVAYLMGVDGPDVTAVGTLLGKKLVLNELVAFLDLLKKYRVRRPINGVLAAVSVADLIEAHPDEVTALTGLGVPDDDDYETVAGLVAEILGRIPAIGDVATVGGIAIEVVRMDGRRVDRLRLAPSGYAEGESDEPVGAST